MSERMMSVDEARECLEVLDVVLMPREVQKIAARTIVAQAEQIERVREARSMINKIIAYTERGVDLGDPVTLAKSIVNKLNDALGDTDD